MPLLSTRIALDADGTWDIVHTVCDHHRLTTDEARELHRQLDRHLAVVDELPDLPPVDHVPPASGVPSARAPEAGVSHPEDDGHV